MLIVGILPRIPIGYPYPESFIPSPLVLRELCCSITLARPIHQKPYRHLRGLDSWSEKAKKEWVAGVAEDRVRGYYHTKGAFTCFNRQE